MGADGLHSAVLEEDDLIQSLHRRDAVRDEQSGLTGTALLEVIEDDFSVLVSTAETESSRIRMGASFSRARAMEMRCF